MSPRRQAQRLQRILLAAAALTLALALHWLWDGWMLTRLRASLGMWYYGYDGCTCSDCAHLFGGADVAAVTWQTQVPFLGYGDRDELGTIAGVYGLILLLLGIFGGTALQRLTRARVRDPSKCRSCGYPLDRLPAGGACPECGERPGP